MQYHHYPSSPAFICLLRRSAWCPQCCLVYNKDTFAPLIPLCVTITRRSCSRQLTRSAQQSAHFTTSSARTIRPSAENTRHLTPCSIRAPSSSSLLYAAPHLDAYFYIISQTYNVLLLQKLRQKEKKQACLCLSQKPKTTTEKNLSCFRLPAKLRTCSSQRNAACSKT